MSKFVSFSQLTKSSQFRSMEMLIMSLLALNLPNVMKQAIERLNELQYSHDKNEILMFKKGRKVTLGLTILNVDCVEKILKDYFQAKRGKVVLVSHDVINEKINSSPTIFIELKFEGISREELTALIKAKECKRVFYRTCRFCKKRKKKLKKCGRCKRTRYCDEECQRSHWESHKVVCKKK